MLEKPPDLLNLTALIGQPLLNLWQELCALIDEKYDMEKIWNTGGKKWTYEYKYRRGGKTLCSLYAKDRCIGLMIIFGKEERAEFERIRSSLSQKVCQKYDAAVTYHDGKWVMFEPVDSSEFEDYLKLLEIKRKPNRR